MTTVSKSFSKNNPVDDYLDGDYVSLYLTQNMTLGEITYKTATHK